MVGISTCGLSLENPTTHGPVRFLVVPGGALAPHLDGHLGPIPEQLQQLVLGADEQVFEDVGSWASWNQPGLNRLKAALQPGDCVKVAALNRLGRSLSEVLEPLGWLRENEVEVISLRESIDQVTVSSSAAVRSTWRRPPVGLAART